MVSDSPRLRPPSSSSPPLREQESSSSPRGAQGGRTPSHKALSNISRCSCPAVSGDTTSLPAVSATRICGPIGSPSLHRHGSTIFIIAARIGLAYCTQLDLEMSFATGEDVMRTVESVIADLTLSLKSDFSVVRKSRDVYLAPKRSLVCGHSRLVTHSLF